MDTTATVPTGTMRGEPASADLAAPADERPRGGPPVPGYLDEAAAAAQLDVKVQTLRKWAVQRKGPPRKKAGKRVLYREEALRAWLVAQETDPAAARRSGLF